MKRITILLILLVLLSPAYAQHKKKKKKKKDNKDAPTWIFIDVGGGYGNAFWTNANGKADEAVQLGVYNPSYHFGGRVGLNLKVGAGIAIDIGSSGHTLKYKYDLNPSITTDPLENDFQKINTFNIGIYARKVSPTGGYIEFGPQFCRVTSNLGVAENNNRISPSHTNLMLAFGGPIYYHQKFDINLGLRVAFSVSDVMDQGNYLYERSDFPTSYADYTPTRLFSLQLKLGVCYHIGYFKKAKCDGHVEFLMF